MKNPSLITYINSKHKVKGMTQRTVNEEKNHSDEGIHVNTLTRSFNLYFQWTIHLIITLCIIGLSIVENLQKRGSSKIMETLDTMRANGLHYLPGCSKSIFEN